MLLKHFKRKDGIKPYFARTHGQQQCLRILSEVTGSKRQRRRHFHELIRITLHYKDRKQFYFLIRKIVREQQCHQLGMSLSIKDSVLSHLKIFRSSVKKNNATFIVCAIDSFSLTKEPTQAHDKQYTTVLQSAAIQRNRNPR